MKILAFSDLHRDVDASRKIADAARHADLLVAAGDFGSHGKGTLEPVGILRTAAKPTILVSGNHDNSSQLRDYCAGWGDGHLLHGAALRLEGIVFFGLGCEIPRRKDEPWNEALDEEDASGMLADCPQGAVLVTHSPPLGIAGLTCCSMKPAKVCALTRCMCGPVSRAFCG